MKKITFLATLLTATIFTTSANANLTNKEVGKNIADKELKSDKEHTFSISKARWKRKPRIKVNLKGKRSAWCRESCKITTRLSVDKKGYITSVKILQSDGTSLSMQRDVKRSLMKSGRFHPFKKNGKAVSGYVTLRINLIIKNEPKFAMSRG